MDLLSLGDLLVLRFGDGYRLALCPSELLRFLVGVAGMLDNIISGVDYLIVRFMVGAEPTVHLPSEMVSRDNDSVVQMARDAMQLFHKVRVCNNNPFTFRIRVFTLLLLLLLFLRILRFWTRARSISTAALSGQYFGRKITRDGCLFETTFSDCAIGTSKQLTKSSS